MGEKEMKLDEDAGLPLVFREMQRMHRSRLQRVLNEYGLYMGQPMILFALERIPDATQKELADALHISSATITTSLQRMEDVYKRQGSGVGGDRPDGGRRR